MHPLKNRTAVVAGATRGAGRGAARALGEAGATVYCTGRSVRGEPSHYNRPETIEETAEMVNKAGGRGIAVRVDHKDDAAVRELFNRVQRDHGRLDVLVNNIAGQDMRMAGWEPFWKTNMENAGAILDDALLSHIITAKHAAPLMIKDKCGLIVEVTEGDMLFSGGNVIAQLVKYTLKGLVVLMAESLRKHKVAAIAITPGYLRSEMMLEHFGVREENWRDGARKDKNFLESETPLFLGRAIVALATDPKVIKRTGEITSSWELSNEYGFTDYDGRRPNFGRLLEEVYTADGVMHQAFKRHNEWLEHLVARGRRYVGKSGQ